MTQPLVEEVRMIQQLLPLFLQHEKMCASYDAEADVLYVQFPPPDQADNSQMTEDEVIVRYQNKQVVGITILHASKRGRDCF